MGIMEDSPKRRSGSIAYQPCCSPHFHSPKSTKGTVSTTEGGCIASLHTWPRPDSAYTGSALDASSYTIHPSYASPSSHERFAMPLSPNSLACMQPSLDQPHVSAPLVETEHSQGRNVFSSKANMASGAHDNDFGFIRDSDDIRDDAAQSIFDVPAYEAFDENGASLQALPNFDHQGWVDWGDPVSEGGYLLPMTAGAHVGGSEHAACCSTRPNPQHTSLVTHLENMTEQYETCMRDENHYQTAQSQAIFQGHACHEQTFPCEDLAEGSFGVQRDINHDLWSSEDMYQTF